MGIAALDAGNLTGDAVVHVVGCEFIDVAVAVFEGVFVGPHVASQRVAVEVFLGGSFHLLNRIYMVFDSRRFLHSRFFLRLRPVDHLHLVLVFNLLGGESGVFPRFDDLVVRACFGLRFRGFLKAAKKVSIQFHLCMV